MASSSGTRFPLDAKDYEFLEEIGDGGYRARCILPDEIVAIEIWNLGKCTNDLILKALVYLHGLGHTSHTHRNVKAGNILVDSEGTVMLGDFEVSACMLDSVERMHTSSGNTFVGTSCCMAPEEDMQQVDGYGFKVDTWSFGMTALELAHGHSPVSKYPPMAVLPLTSQNSPRPDYEEDMKFSKEEEAKLVKGIDGNKEKLAQDTQKNDEQLLTSGQLASPVNPVSCDAAQILPLLQNLLIHMISKGLIGLIQLYDTTAEIRIPIVYTEGGQISTTETDLLSEVHVLQQSVKKLEEEVEKQKNRKRSARRTDQPLDEEQ